jgi:hypothetical protein
MHNSWKMSFNKKIEIDKRFIQILIFFKKKTYNTQAVPFPFT